MPPCPVYAMLRIKPKASNMQGEYSMDQATESPFSNMNDNILDMAQALSVEVVEVLISVQ